jgi:hypothetical protein
LQALVKGIFLEKRIFLRRVGDFWAVEEVWQTLANAF